MTKRKVPVSQSTLSETERTTSENPQLRESPAAAAMEQDSRKAEMERGIVASKEKLLWAKVERQFVKERLKGAV